MRSTSTSGSCRACDVRTDERLRKPWFPVYEADVAVPFGTTNMGVAEGARVVALVAAPATVWVMTRDGARCTTRHIHRDNVPISNPVCIWPNVSARLRLRRVGQRPSKRKY